MTEKKPENGGKTPEPMSNVLKEKCRDVEVENEEESGNR